MVNDFKGTEQDLPVVVNRLHGWLIFLVIPVAL